MTLPRASEFVGLQYAEGCADLSYWLMRQRGCPIESELGVTRCISIQITRWQVVATQSDEDSSSIVT
jgi:hypothetical protein